jgi:anaerobic ribonucleoside-triphosphate reductase activating protein
MYIARILYPVQVLGPGNRVGIWFCGCAHRCEGCSNPELWEEQERYRTDIDTLRMLLGEIYGAGPVDGFTLTGGDPFFQPEALEEILDLIRPASSDILVYTGYTYEFLKERYPHILEKIGVLIDGPYIRQRNNGALLRGSDNQRILIQDPSLRERYEDYFSREENRIQNFTTLDGVISVGIHRDDYQSRVDAILRQKGLKAK